MVKNSLKICLDLLPCDAFKEVEKHPKRKLSLGKNFEVVTYPTLRSMRALRIAKWHLLKSNCPKIMDEDLKEQIQWSGTKLRKMGLR